MDQTVFQKLYQKGIQYGIPLSVWYPIVMTESGGNVEAIGDHGSSYGLLQIHKPAHPTFDVTKYTDPEYQADYFFPTLKATYDQGVSKGLSGADLTAYVEQYGERPKWTDTTNTRIRTAYNSLYNDASISSDLKKDMTPVSIWSGGMLTPPGIGSGSIPSMGKVYGGEDGLGSKLSEFGTNTLYKMAFFIPALILLTLGIIFLFGGSNPVSTIIKKGAGK